MPGRSLRITGSIVGTQVSQFRSLYPWRELTRSSVPSSYPAADLGIGVDHPLCEPL